MTTYQESVRILICDDHPVVRAGLRAVLSQQPNFEIVGEARNGAEAVTLASRLRPDVALMDLRMPEVDGVAAIARIRAERAETRFLVLTTYETDADVLKAAEAGATGFLLKNAPPEEICEGIRDVAQGRSPLTPSAAARLIEQIWGNAEGVLTSRDIDILRLVARGMTNNAIAQEMYLSEATVKGHLHKIFQKLGATDRASAVVTALKRGVIRLEP